MMPWTVYLGIAVAVFVGAFAQGSIGFAFGIISIPLIVLCGMPLEQSIALVLTLVVVQTASAVYRYRRDVPWLEVVQLSVYRFATVPLGVWLLSRLRTTLTVVQIKQFVGGMLLFALATQLLRTQYQTVHPVKWRRLWIAVSGTLSGFLAGLVGMGGPPIVIWSQAQDWSTQRVRALMWALFLILSPWQLLVSYWKFGQVIPKTMLLAVAYVPLVLLGGWLGYHAGDRLSRVWLRRVAYGLLVVVAVFSLFDIV